MESDEIIGSFDVSSHFTNVPANEAHTVIYETLREDESLADRTIFSPERLTELLDM